MTYDLIGTIYEETGKMLTDDSGNVHPEKIAVDGYHVNVLEVTDDLKPFVVTPATPKRVFAGRESDTVCLKFKDRGEWLSMNIEDDEDTIG